MNLKKLLTLALCLCLTLSMAACGTPGETGGTNLGSTEDPGASSSASPSESLPELTPIPDYVHEFTRSVAGVDADTVMFTVDGTDVTAEFFFYWLAYDCYNLDMQSQMYLGVPLDFDQTAPDGGTISSYMKEDGRKMATIWLMLEKSALEEGLGATPEQQAQAAEQKLSFIQSHGGQEAFETLLRQNGLSEELFDRVDLMHGALWQNMLSAIPALTEAEEEQYIQDNDLLRCKHILIRTVVQNDDGSVSFNRANSGTPTNADGTPYTGTAEEYNAAALEKVNGLLTQLAGAEDPLALFDQLMQENSEDPGLASYPDGYDFTAGEMIAEFEQGTRDLEYDQYTAQPVQTSDGYHIILRLRPDVAEQYREERMNSQMEQWASLAYTTTPAYDALDVKDFYEKYTAHVNSYMEDPAQESGTAAPSASPSESAAPSETPSESPSEAPSESPSEEPGASSDET